MSFRIPTAPKQYRGKMKDIKTVIRDSLLVAGVANLKEFGYPSCTKDNILTDYVYAKFFLGMLKENKGIAANLDAEIDGLIAECEKAVAKGMGKGKKAKK